MQQAQQPSLPGSLIAVAVLFIILGVFSAVEILASLAQGNISLNIGVLGIFVGFGLLRLSRGWRTCGLVLLWIFMILCSIVMAIMLMAPVAGTSETISLLILLAALLGLAAWQYHVLTRPHIRALFGLY